MTEPAASFHDLLRRALDGPPATVGTYDRRSRSFHLTDVATVLGAAATAARRLIEGGLTRQQPVMVVAGSPELLWRGYLAAVLAGGVPVLLPIRPTFDTAHDVERKLSAAAQQMPDALLMLQTSAQGAPCVEPGPRSWSPLTAGSGAGAGAGLDRTDDSGGADDVRDLLRRCRSNTDTPLHLQLTSGSTGDAKPVVVTHGNVMANVGRLIDVAHLDRRSHLVCWLPLYHDLALAGSALASVMAGSHLRLLSPFDFLADPAHWLHAVSQCDDAVSAAPNFALDYLTRRFDPDRSTSKGLDLSNWRICFTGAEPVDATTVTRFLHRFEPFGFRPEALRPAYGLAEATIMVSLTAEGQAPRTLSVRSASVSASGPVEVLASASLRGQPVATDVTSTWVASLGPAATCLTMELVDAEGRTVGVDDVCGEVVVSGPSVSPGYRRTDGTIESFPDGRCATGDIGFTHDGELYLVERLKNIIIRNGQNYPAAAFEQHLAHAAGLPLDRVAVIQTSFTGNRVAAVVESARGTVTAELVAAVGEVAAELELPIDEIVLIERNGLPRTTSGKKQHALLRSALRDGSITVLARADVTGAGPVGVGGGPPSDDGIVIDLDRTDVVDRAFEVIELHARQAGWRGLALTLGHRLAADLGFDSLGLIELAVDLEATVGRPVPEQTVNDMETVGDLVAILLRSGKPAAGAVAGADSAARTDAGAGGSSTTEAVSSLVREVPQTYRHVEAQRGRQLRVDGRWITDFASVNYLGLDLHPAVAAAIGPMVADWGTHPSWTRAVASPAPYRQLELALADLVGAPDAMVFPTITLIHIGVLPLLATRRHTLIVDRSAHRSIQEGAELAVARGAGLRWFRHDDLSTLTTALDGVAGRPVVAVDGVYSMSGQVPDLDRICRLTEEAGGLVYVDDAHGFGVLGRRPSEANPYGAGGAGVAARLGLDLRQRNLVYVAGMSKAFSSMAAFVTCRDADQRALFERASTAIFSGPVPVPALATALAALAVNAVEGDQRRRHLHALTARIIAGARSRGYPVDNQLALPIVNLVTGDLVRTVAASKLMWEQGILFTPSIFPAAPLGQGGFRISVTAANTHDEVDRLLLALDEVTRVLGPPSAHQADRAHQAHQAHQADA